MGVGGLRASGAGVRGFRSMKDCMLVLRLQSLGFRGFGVTKPLQPFTT